MKYTVKVQVSGKVSSESADARTWQILNNKPKYTICDHKKPGSGTVVSGQIISVLSKLPIALQERFGIKCNSIPFIRILPIYS